MSHCGHFTDDHGLSLEEEEEEAMVVDNVDEVGGAAFLMRNFSMGCFPSAAGSLSPGRSTAMP